MRLLITGGNGNLAKIINKHLLSEFEIVCITRKDFDLLSFQELTNYLSGKKFDVLIIDYVDIDNLKYSNKNNIYDKKKFIKTCISNKSNINKILKKIQTQIIMQHMRMF